MVIYEFQKILGYSSSSILSPPVGYMFVRGRKGKAGHGQGGEEAVVITVFCL